MPGSFVILNGVKSMLSPGLLREPSWLVRYALTAFSIVGVSLLYAVLDAWLATLIVSIILGPGLISQLLPLETRLLARLCGTATRNRRGSRLGRDQGWRAQALAPIEGHDVGRGT